MLEQLEELEKDILSGSPTLAAQRLKAALAAQAENRESLTPAQQTVLDEIDARAAIEVAKLETQN